MNHLNKLALAVIATFALTACSGGSSSNTNLFGDVPEILQKYDEEQDALKEKGKNIKSEEEKAKLIAESKKVDEEYTAKVETASKKLDGKALDVTSEDFDITTPISLTYEEISSAKKLNPKFKVNGEAKTTKEIALAQTVFSTKCPVQIVGFDAEGNEVYHLQVGTVEVATENGQSTVAAGAPVEFTTLTLRTNYLEDYSKATSLKLEARPI